MPPSVFALIFIAIVVSIIIRLFAGGMDSDRVGEYIRSQGGELIDTKWSPFGRGWFGEKNDRIYEVRYRDHLGNVHEATVKTSLLSGVYFTEDRIVAPAEVTESAIPSDSPSNVEDLELENARLRARIAELENKQEN